MDLRDDTETAEKLFKLVNIIVDRTISDPKRVGEIYDGPPVTKRAAINAGASRNKQKEEDRGTSQSVPMDRAASSRAER